MKFLKYLINKLSSIEGFILSSLVLFNMIILFITVVMRYLFNASPTWTQEASRYLLIWIVYLGVLLSIENDSEIRIDALTQFIKSKRIITMMNLFRYAFCLTLSILISIYSLYYLYDLYQFNERAASFDLALFYIFLIIPLSGIIMFIKYSFKFINIVIQR